MSIGITSTSLGYSRSASDLRYLGKTGLQTLSGALSINELSLAGSGSLSGSALNIAQTWKTSGTPTAIKLDVTDTASNANGLLMDLQVGGSSKFSVRKDGLATALAIKATGSGSNFAGVTSSAAGFFSQNGGRIGISNTGYLGFSNTGDATGTLDIHIYRDTSDTLAQRRGTNSQEFRLYNTYTDASNYERLSLKANAGAAFTITSEAAGTGVVRSISISPELSTPLIKPTAIQFSGTGPTTITGASGEWFFNYFGTARASFKDGVGLRLGSNWRVAWSNATNNSATTIDTEIRRHAANVLTISNGTTSDQGSLRLNNLKAIGDIEAETIGNGVILKSTNGTRYRITVDDSGALVTTALP